MTPPPADKPGRPGPRKIILVAVATLLALCGIGAGVVAYVRHSQAQEIAPVREASDTYLRHLEAGEYDAAYAQLCGNTRASYTRTSFAAAASGKSKLASHTLTSVDLLTVNRVTGGSVTARLTYANGSTATRTLLLAKESGTWKVCDVGF